MKMSSQKVIAIAIVMIVLYCCGRSILAASCVWKVTSSDGHSLYLGGSFHALRPSDYPLPSQYNRAFDACSRLAFEDDPKAGEASFRALVNAGEYPKGDSLKNHVDPRTYAYLRRLDGRNHNWIPKIENYLRSGQVYFVVVGAAHMGGSSGLLALLRQGGCKIEQL